MLAKIHYKRSVITSRRLSGRGLILTRFIRKEKAKWQSRRKNRRRGRIHQGVSFREQRATESRPATRGRIGGGGLLNRTCAKRTNMAQSRIRAITAQENQLAPSSEDKPATEKNCSGINLNTAKRQADTSQPSELLVGCSFAPISHGFGSSLQKAAY